MNTLTLVSMLVAAAFTVSGCATTKVRSTAPPVAAEAAERIPEDLLLDVGIGIFDPGLDDVDEDQVFPEIRKAEARYVPNALVTTLQNTGNWGVVRLIPDRQSEMDVWVDGTILESDGERLKVRIAVQDSSGQAWFTREYEEETSKYSYEKDFVRKNEPFQGLYNRIANDMLAHRQALDAARVRKLRTISELKFARRFSPEAFSDHLNVDKRGRYEISRLPAENDPLLERVRRIRERDNLFVDTLQEYYTSFTRQMREPYSKWRAESYKEIHQVRQLESSRRKHIAAGVLAILGGVGAAVLGGTSDNSVAQTAGIMAGMAGVAGGAALIKSGLEKGAEARLHLETLREMSASLDAEIEPHSVVLEDRTVTLTGTVQQQYDQWREILRQIYETETGGVLTSQADPRQ